MFKLLLTVFLGICVGAVVADLLFGPDQPATPSSESQGQHWEPWRSWYLSARRQARRALAAVTAWAIAAAQAVDRGARRLGRSAVAIVQLVPDSLRSMHARRQAVAERNAAHARHVAHLEAVNTRHDPLPPPVAPPLHPPTLPDQRHTLDASRMSTMSGTGGMDTAAGANGDAAPGPAGANGSGQPDLAGSADPTDPAGWTGQPGVPGPLPGPAGVADSQGRAEPSGPADWSRPPDWPAGPSGPRDWSQPVQRAGSAAAADRTDIQPADPAKPAAAGHPSGGTDRRVADDPSERRGAAGPPGTDPRRRRRGPPMGPPPPVGPPVPASLRGQELVETSELPIDSALANLANLSGGGEAGVLDGSGTSGPLGRPPWDALVRRPAPREAPTPGTGGRRSRRRSRRDPLDWTPTDAERPPDPEWDEGVPAPIVVPMRVRARSAAMLLAMTTIFGVVAATAVLIALVMAVGALDKL